MRWKSIEPAWRVCFEEAWAAYCRGSVPIGAAITDASGEIIARGRNRVSDPDAPSGQICSGQLAHAEMNVLLQLDRDVHQVRSCTLWTTMEPCPLCFGAFYMSGVRILHYAARDPYAGSTNLAGATEYLKRKPLTIRGPVASLELVQIVIKTDYLLRFAPVQGSDRVLEALSVDCPAGVQLGRQWFGAGILPEFRDTGTTIATIAEQIWDQLREGELLSAIES